LVLRISPGTVRVGLATSAAAAGKSERAITNQTGHRSLKRVRRHIRQGSVFRENAGDGLGCELGFSQVSVNDVLGQASRE